MRKAAMEGMASMSVNVVQKIIITAYICTQNATLLGLKERWLSNSSSSQSDVDHSDNLEEEQKSDIEEPQPKKRNVLKGTYVYNYI